ncbi:MAG TPA: cysteine hydrolase [Firmicutes bacterium]|nr:cysteine hydrolase [Bacillota bacterium]
MEYAIFVVDMIHDFVDGKFENKKAIEIIPNIKKLVSSAREKGIPIIFLRDAHEKGDPEEKVWGAHAIRGTWGSEIVDELSPRPSDYLIDKRTYSGFFKTDLELLLKKLEIEAVILTGVSTNICVQHNAADLFFRGYSIIVASDGTAAFTEEDHNTSLKYMETVYGAKILKTDDILEMLEEEK